MVKRFFALILALLSLSFVATAALVPEPDTVEPCSCAHPFDRLVLIAPRVQVDVPISLDICVGSYEIWDKYQCTICGEYNYLNMTTMHYTHYYNDDDDVYCDRPGCTFNYANGMW